MTCNKHYHLTSIAFAMALYKKYGDIKNIDFNNFTLEPYLDPTAPFLSELLKRGLVK